MKAQHVWVVEMLNPMNGRWEPCSDVALWKRGGEHHVREWRGRNKDDRFRLAKYVRELPPAARQRRGR